MAKKIRSEYLQQLLEDKDSLYKKLNDVTQSTVASIMGKTIEENIRKIISEDEDSFVEDEVDDIETTDSTDDTSAEDVSVDTEEVADDNAADEETEEEETVEDTDAVEDEVDTEVSTEDDDTDVESDVWDDLESYKGEDGEYDLTGMGTEQLIKVMQVMKPTDGVRVLKNDNGTITLSDDETEKEYIIDLDGDTEDTEEETTFELETDEDLGESCEKECNEANLGYTDNFQNKTAMTTPSNNEPADSKTTYSMDGGVPTGTEKRWANQGDKAPYDEKVSESEEVDTEIEVDDEEPVNETMTTQEQGPYNRGDGMVHTNTNDKAAKGRNSSAGGEKIHGTSDNSYSDAKLESVMRKANAIFNENKELKALVPQMKAKLMESIVINKSMGNIMNLVIENSTTLNEKKEILKRFTNVKTIEESDKLYATISEELKRDGRKLNVEGIINSQLAESKNTVVDKPLYQSEDLSKTLSLINRLNKIK